MMDPTRLAFTTFYLSLRLDRTFAILRDIKIRLDDLLREEGGVIHFNAPTGILKHHNST